MTAELPRQFSELQLDDGTLLLRPVLVRPGEDAYCRRWFDAWIASDGRGNIERLEISVSLTIATAVWTRAHLTENMARRFGLYVSNVVAGPRSSGKLLLFG